MSNRYVVWSAHPEEQPDGSYLAREVVEVTRSDRKVAEEDAGIVRDILHRKAWVQDTEEGK
jgi:hypothetical protein